MWGRDPGTRRRWPPDRSGLPDRDPGGVQTRTRVGDVAALSRCRAKGGFVVAAERGFVLLDDQLRETGRVPVFIEMNRCS